MEPGTTKSCSKCGNQKPVSAFYKKGGRTDSACKSCINAAKKQKRLELKASKNYPTATTKKTILKDIEFSVSEQFHPDVTENTRSTIAQSFIEMALKGEIDNA